mmetsp:Transcript_13711/g.29790  ORF Transcript_13711/g.29790 Transcript_13711/m.29790 type:complete len:249 (-) Transcript_13711:572-1318(-)
MAGIGQQRHARCAHPRQHAPVAHQRARSEEHLRDLPHHQVRERVQEDVRARYSSSGEDVERVPPLEEGPRVRDDYAERLLVREGRVQKEAINHLALPEYQYDIPLPLDLRSRVPRYGLARVLDPLGDVGLHALQEHLAGGVPLQLSVEVGHGQLQEGEGVSHADGVRPALRRPVLECRFEQGVVDVVAKVARRGRRGVRLEEKGKCLEHGAAARVAAQERVGDVQVAQGRDGRVESIIGQLIVRRDGG